MKLLFSESQFDYQRYLYPYVIWAVREADETPADLFNAGFLPSARGLNQFYLCRHVRLDLTKFSPSSENRRILRKGDGIEMKLVPRAAFDLTPARREFYKSYADVRYGKEVMPPERLEQVFNSALATHLLVFTDAQSGAELGVVVLYLEPPRLAFYRYAFYDLSHFNRSLGLFMMTAAAVLFVEQECAHLYLGTCYSERALYKTQFTGLEFFNGFRWSANVAELKALVRRENDAAGPHLLAAEDFRKEFYDGDIESIATESGFRVPVKPATA